MALTKVTKSGITDNSIDADKIEDGTIVAADIADGTITNAKLAGSIANNKLGQLIYYSKWYKCFFRWFSFSR
jgi:hypothetical protein